jgi:hypothetical protein
MRLVGVLCIRDFFEEAGFRRTSHSIGDWLAFPSGVKDLSSERKRWIVFSGSWLKGKLNIGTG